MQRTRGRTPAEVTDEETTAGANAGLPPSVVVLGAMAMLFLFRVAAQAIQAVADVAWLPAFDAWQSGAVAYPILLGSQVAILITQLFLVLRVMAGRFRPRPLVRMIVLAIGSLYFSFMLFRLVAGFTFLSGHPWFDAPLPSIFHMVLASFLLVLSRAGTTRSGIPS